MPKDHIFKDLQKVLFDTIGSLEPVPYQPENIAEYETVVFDRTEHNNTKWKELIAAHIHTAKTFEIHCWLEETKAISLALQYGTVKPKNWKHGTIIEGAITPEFTDMLLNQPKPSDTSIYNMMTPFFSIMLDNGFSSEHYGTENHIKLG